MVSLEELVNVENKIIQMRHSRSDIFPVLYFYAKQVKQENKQGIRIFYDVRISYSSKDTALTRVSINDSSFIALHDSILNKISILDDLDDEIKYNAVKAIFS